MKIDVYIRLVIKMCNGDDEKDNLSAEFIGEVSSPCKYDVGEFFGVPENDQITHLLKVTEVSHHAKNGVSGVSSRPKIECLWEFTLCREQLSGDQFLFKVCDEFKNTYATMLKKIEFKCLGARCEVNGAIFPVSLK